MTENPQDNASDAEDPAEQSEGDPALTEGRVITPVDEERDDDDGN
ncbi:hypothetical protein [Arthrobacter sp. H5]|nr:hypothetical protein [Arthrobacter sp. H5]